MIISFSRNRSIRINKGSYYANREFHGRRTWERVRVRPKHTVPRLSPTGWSARSSVQCMGGAPGWPGNLRNRNRNRNRRLRLVRPVAGGDSFAVGAPDTLYWLCACRRARCWQLLVCDHGLFRKSFPLVPDRAVDFPLFHNHPLQQVVALGGKVPLSTDNRYHAHDLCDNLCPGLAAHGLGRKSLDFVEGRLSAFHVRQIFCMHPQRMHPQRMHLVRLFFLTQGRI